MAKPPSKFTPSLIFSILIIISLCFAYTSITESSRIENSIANADNQEADTETEESLDNYVNLTSVFSGETDSAYISSDEKGGSRKFSAAPVKNTIIPKSIPKPNEHIFQQKT